ncbi:MAG: anthranilate phosphoribosyltransferase [Phycisphaerales bacterium]|nr:anthranilate phosphoribosyltransferase [Phycisphaerales bacterium]
MDETLDHLITTLERGHILPIADAARAMIAIADGQAGTPTIVRFLRAYNRRPPVVHEISAFVDVLRERMISVQAPAPNTICNCGTGGDGRGTINVSTIAAFVIAAAGVPVAKHGNRSVSSSCGSTDCLARMGVAVSREPQGARSLLEEHQLCFLNAPDFHPALRHVSAARSELAARGERSIFNLLGPVLNPASVTRQTMGIFHADMLLTIAQVLVQSGTQRAYVVHGDGYDELSVTGASRIARISGGGISLQSIVPEDFRLRRADPAEIAGGDAATNARLAEGILRGSQDGAMADVVLLNAAAGISAGAVNDVDIQDALEVARGALASGRAYRKLEDMRKAAPAHVA